MNRVSTRGDRKNDRIPILFTISVLVGAIAFLLILQTILIGINAENHISQGDSPIEVLIWMINQCIPVLKQASSFPEKQKKSLHTAEYAKAMPAAGYAYAFGKPLSPG